MTDGLELAARIAALIAVVIEIAILMRAPRFLVR